MKAYFFQTQLETGEYINLVYETKHKRGTWNHLSDIIWQCNMNKVDLKDGEIKQGKHWRDPFDMIYSLTDKNKEDCCFDDYMTIDLRTMSRRWYAVMQDNEDSDWGTGSYYLEDAQDMVNNYKANGYNEAYIAVIDNHTQNPVCIDEIRR